MGLIRTYSTLNNFFFYICQFNRGAGAALKQLGLILVLVTYELL